MGPRLLIVAGEAAANAEQLPRAIRSLIDAAAELMVVSPALPGRLDWISSDTDKATERADERLPTVLGQLDEMGAEARGRIGADDPLLAFEDAIPRVRSGPPADRPSPRESLRVAGAQADRPDHGAVRDPDYRLSTPDD